MTCKVKQKNIKTKTIANTEEIDKVINLICKIFFDGINADYITGTLLIYFLILRAIKAVKLMTVRRVNFFDKNKEEEIEIEMPEQKEGK